MVNQAYRQAGHMCMNNPNRKARLLPESQSHFGGKTTIKIHPKGFFFFSGRQVNENRHYKIRSHFLIRTVVFSSCSAVWSLTQVGGHNSSGKKPLTSFWSKNTKIVRSTAHNIAHTAAKTQTELEGFTEGWIQSDRVKYCWERKNRSSWKHHINRKAAESPGQLVKPFGRVIAKTKKRLGLLSKETLPYCY